MKVVNKPEYVAEDGTKFADKAQCLKYEREEMQVALFSKRVVALCKDKLGITSLPAVDVVCVAAQYFNSKPKDFEALFKGLKLPKAPKTTTKKAKTAVAQAAPKSKKAPKAEVKVEAPKPLDKTQPYLKIVHGPDRTKTEIQVKLGTTVETAHAAIAHLQRPIHDLQLVSSGRGQILPNPAK